MRRWMRFKHRGDATRAHEGSTLTEQQLKEQQVPHLRLFAIEDYYRGLTALTASCTRDSERLKGNMNGISTYENLAFFGQWTHLCSIRRTRYCSLGRSISSRSRGARVKSHQGCSMRDLETAPCAAVSSQTSTGEIQENGWRRTYRKAARTRGPSGSWPATGCRKGHKRGIWSSVQWGQARAEMACRRNEGSLCSGE